MPAAVFFVQVCMLFGGHLVSWQDAASVRNSIWADSFVAKQLGLLSWTGLRVVWKKTPPAGSSGRRLLEVAASQASTSTSSEDSAASSWIDSSDASGSSSGNAARRVLQQADNLKGATVSWSDGSSTKFILSQNVSLAFIRCRCASGCMSLGIASLCE